MAQPRKLKLLHGRSYFTDAGGQPSKHTLDHFDNQQMMKSGIRRRPAVTAHILTHMPADADYSQPTQQPPSLDVGQPSLCNRHDSVALPDVVLEQWPVAEVPNRLQTLQHQHQFSLHDGANKPETASVGGHFLVHYCHRGLTAVKTYMKQCIPVGSRTQGRSAATPQNISVVAAMLSQHISRAACQMRVL